MRPALAFAAVPLLLLAAAWVAPTASAALEVTVVAPTDPILPLSGSGTLNATVSLDCQEVIPRSGVPPTSMVVTLANDAPDGVRLNGPGTVSLSAAPCLGAGASGRSSASVDYNVTMGTAVPALTQQSFTITASVAAGAEPTVQPAMSDNATVQVQAAPFPVLDVEGTVTTVPVTGGRASFTLQLANRGNIPVLAQVNATFNVTGVEPGSVADAAGAKVIAPGTAVPAGNATAGNFTFEAPTGEWTVVSASITVRPAAVGDPANALGAPVTLFVTFENAEPPSEESPASPAGLLALGLLATAAVAARRRA